jgi:para-nitrobenzyl esterase
MGAFFGLVPALQSIDEATVRKRLRGRLGAEADDAYAAYLRSRPRRRPIDVLTDAVTDEVFRMPTLRLAEAHARVGRAAYVYQLDWPAPGYGGALGACHTLDLPLVFGDPQRWQPTAHMLDGAEPTILAGLAEAMSQSWAAFVRDGNPGHDGAPAWPPYDASRRMTMRFHVLTEVVSDAARTWRPFW